MQGYLKYAPKPSAFVLLGVNDVHDRPLGFTHLLSAFGADST